MPRILVTTDGSDGREAAVLLQQRVAPADLESDDRLCARLVERVGWALVDADELERGAPPPAHGRSGRTRRAARGRLGVRARPGRSSAR